MSQKSKKRKFYATADVEGASKDVTENIMSYRRAEEVYKVPKSIIERCVKNDGVYRGATGRKRMLGAEVEEQLAQFVEKRAAMNAGVTKKVLLAKAKALADA